MPAMRDPPDAAPRADHAAFAAAFEEHFAAVHGYLRRRAGDGAAEELAAETFVRAYGAWASFDPGRGTLRGWLFGIAVHLLQDHERGEARRRRAYARAAETARGEDAEVEASIARLDAAREDATIGAALAALRTEEREVLLLTAWAELGYAEIAQVLGVPIGTVRSRLARARRAVRFALENPEVSRAR